MDGGKYDENLKLKNKYQMKESECFFVVITSEKIRLVRNGYN